MMAYIADIVVGFRGRGVAGQIFRAAPMKRSPRRWCSMRAVPCRPWRASSAANSSDSKRFRVGAR